MNEKANIQYNKNPNKYIKTANVLKGLSKSNFKEFKFISFVKIQVMKIIKPVMLVIGKKDFISINNGVRTVITKGIVIIKTKSKIAKKPDIIAKIKRGK